MWSIVLNTYKAFWRKGLLAFFSFLAGSVFLTALLFGQLALTEQLKVVVDFSLFGIEIVGLIFVVFFGSRLLEDEKNYKTIELLHLFVVDKKYIILGKYLGFVLVMFAYIFLMAVIYSLMMWFFGAGVEIWSWSMLAIFFIFLKFVVVFAFVLLCALWVGSRVSLFLGMVFYVLAHSASFLYYYYEVIVQENIFVELLAKGAYYILPQFELLSLKEYLFVPQALLAYDFVRVGGAILFHVVYALLLLFVCVRVYNRKASSR